MKALEYIKRFAKWCLRHYAITASFLMIVMDNCHLTKEYMNVYAILSVFMAAGIFGFFWNMWKYDTISQERIDNQRKIADELEKLNRNLQK